MEKLASSIVREGALPPEDAVGWAYRLALSLQLLHGVGRAHGRISAKAIDLLGRSCDSAGFFLDAHELPDDPGYHSPERLAGDGPSAADDVWAVGVLLFYALTGEQPFHGTNAIEVSASLLASGPPSLQPFGIDAPGLERVIEQLLALDPDDRIRSTRPLCAVLVEWYDFLENLAPLKLGRPALAVFDEPSDDEGQKLTEVIQATPEMLEARVEFARRRAERKAREAPVDAKAEPAPSAAGEGRPRSNTAPGLGTPPATSPAHAPSPDVAPDVDVDGALGPPPESPTGPPAPVWQAPAAAAPQELSHARGRTDAMGPAAPSNDLPRSEGDAADVGLSEHDLPIIGDSTRWTAAPAPLTEAVADTTIHDPPVAEQVGPSPKRGLWWVKILLALACMGVGGGAAHWWIGKGGRLPFVGTGPTPTEGATSERPAAPASTPGPDASEGGSSTSPAGSGVASGGAAAGSLPSSDPSPDPSSRASTGPRVPASAESDLARPGVKLRGPVRCVAGLFAPDAWPSYDPPDLEFICQERSAIKGARRLHVVLTAAGRSLPAPTIAMREWALLTWYDKAVFALARAQCCTDPAALDTEPDSPQCAFDETVTALVDAARGTNIGELETARRAFHESAACLLRGGLGTAYGQVGLPASGSFTVFARIAERARQTRMPTSR